MRGSVSVSPLSRDHAARLWPATCATTTLKEMAMAGKFELYQDKAGKYRFRLKAGNGEIIAVGEAYESKASAQKGIESVKRNAAEADVVEVESD